ncbi:hypothetical protein DH2020_020414 [Rehmannia glutinosa]|uniref:Uncharacterized protein n=1 Tax=Rehmannia glutinosa TaxID=99300 RepID=A0ABR0WK69_REHGL
MISRNHNEKECYAKDFLSAEEEAKAAPPPQLSERTHVRQSGDPERRRETESASNSQTARREIFPVGFVDEREGLLLNFEDRNGETMAVQILVLEQQPELRHDQRLEPFRQGKSSTPATSSRSARCRRLGKDRLFIDWRRRP